MTWKLTALLVIPVAALLAAPGAVRANFVTNGSFETSTNGPGELGFNTTVTGWTSPDFGSASNGQNYLFSATTADTTGSPGINGPLSIWGPPLGANNGFTASPDGGNFIGADADPAYNGRIQQTITGLTPGTNYVLSFFWAGAQQSGQTGATTEQFQVSLGSQTQSTAVLNNANMGFTGWKTATFTYTATSATETLSFLALGTPSGLPPFALLDGVSLNAVPEPSTMLLLSIGLVGLGLGRRLRGRTGSAAA